jgi:hypothetical protein
VAGDDLRLLADRCGEGHLALVLVALDLDADEHRESEPDARAVERRAIAGDHALALQPLHPPEARRRREPDARRELDIAEAAVHLQRARMRRSVASSSARGLILSDRASPRQIMPRIAPRDGAHRKDMPLPSARQSCEAGGMAWT